MASSSLQTEDSHHAEIVLFDANNSTYLSATQGIYDDEPMIAVDTEGVSLGAEGPMTLIQVYAPKANIVYLIDIKLDLTLISAPEGIRRVLESPTIIKVIHAVESDSAAFLCQHNLLLRAVFDVQAADVVLQEGVGIGNFSFRRGMNALLEHYGCETHTSKQLVAEMQENRDYWAVRPLTREMIMYAAQDVTILVPKLYNIINQKIKQNNLSEMLENHTEKQLYARITEPFENICKPYHDNVWKHMKKNLEEMEVNNVQYRSLSTVQSQTIKELNLSSENGPKRVFYWKDTAEFSIIGVSPYLDKILHTHYTNLLDQIKRNYRRTEFPNKYLKLLFTLSSTNFDSEIKYDAKALVKPVGNRWHDMEWPKIIQCLQGIQAKNIGRHDKVAFNELEMKYLNQIFLSHERGNIRYFNKHRAAPVCVVQFLQNKLEKQLGEIEQHRNGTQTSRMSEQNMERTIEGAIRLPYPDLKNRAIKLLK